MVGAKQVLGEMDAVDLEDRIVAQVAALNSAKAMLNHAKSKLAFTKKQAQRYERLFAAQATSEESVAVKRQELAEAAAALAAAHEDIARLNAEHDALLAQHFGLKLVAPVEGLVVAREAEPGSTVVAGQSVIEIVDPNSLWVNARFNQISADGLAANLPAQIFLQTRRSESINGQVLRLEPRADVVTEESLAKITFDKLPASLPQLGELAEVTVQLAKLPAAPTIPNAAIQIVDGQRGVWRLSNEELEFAPLTLGQSDLDGNIQVITGLAVGDEIVVHSEKQLTKGSTIHIVKQISRSSR